MPVYAFICNCGNKKEVFYYANDNHLTICEKCNNIMNKNYKEMIPAYHDVPINSVDYDLTGNPIYYSTKGQLKAIARKHGCSVV